MFYYDLSGYYIKTDNDFDRYRITDPMRSQETFYRNIGSSERYGFEFYSKFIPVKPLILQLAYTYTSYKYTNSTPTQIVMDDTTNIKFITNGKFLPNIPQHQLYLDAQYTLCPGLSLGLAIEAQSKTFIDGANIDAEAAEGYALLHGRIVYNWRLGGYSGQLSFNIKNITDKQYVGFTEPDPGGNAYQPAARREFFGGIKINF